MSTPPVLTPQMFDAAVAASDEQDCDHAICHARAMVGAVGQMIADQAAMVERLRIAKVIRGLIERAESTGDVFDADGAAWLRDAIEAIEKPTEAT